MLYNFWNLSTSFTDVSPRIWMGQVSAAHVALCMYIFSCLAATLSHATFGPVVTQREEAGLLMNGTCFAYTLI